MKTLYLDCGAGISGNMFLGSMIDLGLSVDTLEQQLKKLAVPLPGFQVVAVNRQGISAKFFEVNCSHEHHHRHLSDIIGLINDARFEDNITDSAIKCFSFLAEAEAKIHGVPIDEIHFHEVGAIDAIVDIVGAFLALAYFEIEKIFVSPIRGGFGTVQCAHGIIPVPAPATVELLANFKVYGGEYPGEWTTPTGAAIIKTIAEARDSLPMMKILKTGYGAGSQIRDIPNILRVILGDIEENQCDTESQMIVETNIDDMNPEYYSFLGELFLAAGAKDYFYTPILMKKGRPGVLISVITPVEKAIAIEDILLRETTTLGIRKHLVQRRCLERDYLEVEINGYRIKVKTAVFNGKVFKYAPEYEDCLLVAKTLNRTVIDIYNEANYKARKILYDEGTK